MRYAWLYGFGGVRVDGRASWPVRVLGDEVDAVQPQSKAQVLKARKPGSTLCFSFGDERYVWAKPQSLTRLTMRAAKAALERAAEGSTIHAALRDALVHVLRLW